MKASELDVRWAAGTDGPGRREMSKWPPGLWAVPVRLSHLARPDVVYEKQGISSSKETKAGQTSKKWASLETGSIQQRLLRCPWTPRGRSGN